jgi:hypothetical protein
MDQSARLNDVVDSYFCRQGVEFVVKNYNNIREDYYSSKYPNTKQKPRKEKDNKSGKE